MLCTLRVKNWFVENGTCVCPWKSLRGNSHRNGLALRDGSICHWTGLGSGIEQGPNSLSHLRGWAFWAGYQAHQVVGLSGEVEGKENLD